MPSRHLGSKTLPLLDFHPIKNFTLMVTSRTNYSVAKVPWRVVRPAGCRSVRLACGFSHCTELVPFCPFCALTKTLDPLNASALFSCYTLSRIVCCPPSRHRYSSHTIVLPRSPTPVHSMPRPHYFAPTIDTRSLRTAFLNKRGKTNPANEFKTAAQLTADVLKGQVSSGLRG